MTKTTIFVRFADVLVRLKERKRTRTKETSAVSFPSQTPRNNERRAFSS